MLSDIEIAKMSKMLSILEIGKKISLGDEDLELYGKYKAKITNNALKAVTDNKSGKLVLVTAVNPTPAGEGKTTTTVAIGQAMGKIGKNAIIALREPSLGPVFGVKGGAAGGGYSQVVPMEDINLHFTGDMHAITAANNLLCAAIDNHIFHGNNLNIDPRRVVFKRVMDMNDRNLRNIVVGLNGKANGMPREDGFMITVASEIMAILCLCKDITDLKNRFGNITVGYTFDNKPIYCKDLKVEGAMAALMKDAIKPNLVQTLENTPCIIHGGPFANIAHGCNSIIATKYALKIADYCITEAGFGADLGAEKFLNIKCRKMGISPDCIVLVATIRALKYNGGVRKEDLKLENIDALKKGSVNLIKHIENLLGFGQNVVVALNHFYADTDSEIEEIKMICDTLDVPMIVSKGFEKGGEGATELAKKICELCDKPSKLNFTYNENDSIEDKIRNIVTKIYGGKDVVFTKTAQNSIAKIKEVGMDNLPVCMAKTQYSLSDDAAALGRPTDFTITVRDVLLRSGAGFNVVLTGDIMTMPGLPKVPAAEIIDIDENLMISGLF